MTRPFIVDVLQANLQKLLAKGKDFPVLLKFSPEARDYFRDCAAKKFLADLPDGTRQKITDDLRRLLKDRGLFNALYTYYKKNKDVFPGSCLYTQNHESFMLIQWLVIQLNKKGILDNEGTPLDQESENYLTALNSRLLLDSFGMRGAFSFSIFVDEHSIRRTLEKAGYECTAEFHFIKTHIFLEFKKKNQSI
jgi:hypothetical protein